MWGGRPSSRSELGRVGRNKLEMGVNTLHWRRKPADAFCLDALTGNRTCARAAKRYDQGRAVRVVAAEQSPDGRLQIPSTIPDRPVLCRLRLLIRSFGGGG